MIDETTNSKLEHLAQLIAPGATLVRSWSLDGGISATMIGFEIERPGGETEKLVSRHPGSWALERDSNAAATEFHLLSQLQAQGLAVPEPIYLDDGKKAFDHVSLVTRYIEGAPEFHPKDIELYAQRSAQQLLAIHRTDISELTSVPLAWDTVTSRINWQVERPDHPQRDLEVRAVLKDILPDIKPGPSVFMHGDFWPGNSIWRDGHIVCVIDWEEPRIGDALYEVSITRSELLFNFGEEAMREFTNSYQSLSGIDLADLPFWDLCAALRPMGNFAKWAAPSPSLGRPDITEATMRAAHLEFVDDAMAKLGR